MASGLTIVAAPTIFAARKAADHICTQRVGAGDRVVRALPDARQASSVQRELADDGTPSLGIDVTTLDRWVADRWALFGDGRRLVDARHRRALVVKALETTHVVALNVGTSGIVGCIEKVVRTASGLVDYSVTFSNSGSTVALAPQQVDALAVCAAYERLLDEEGMLEPSAAACALVESMRGSRWPHLVLDGIGALTPAQEVLVRAACGQGGATLATRMSGGDGAHRPASALADALAASLAQACAEGGVPVTWLDASGIASPVPSPWLSPEIAELAGTLFHPQGGRACTPMGDVRFCMPAGRYAEPEAIARVVAQLVTEGVQPREILLCCRDPLAMQQAISGRLAVQGIQCHALGSVPSALTNAGRAALQLADLEGARLACGGLPKPEPRLRPVAGDLLRNALMGVGPGDAQATDERWRAARLFGAADFLDGLSQVSQRTEALDALDAGDCALLASGLAPQPTTARETSTVQLERNAAEGIAQLFATAQDLGVDVLGHAQRLVAGSCASCSRLSVPASSLAAQQQASVLAADPNAVRICTLRDAEGRRARAVLVCDLTADAYPLKDAVDASDGLLGALGVPARPAHVDELRWQLFSAIEAAGRTLVLERPLNDENAGALRPCALLEEVVDCYRRDVTDVAGLDGRTGLPKDGALPLEEQLGEERVGSVACPVGDALDRACQTAAMPELLLRRASSRGMLIDPTKPLSPSAIEDYLRCPMYWFHGRRLPSNGIDAGFGSLEVGTFCHAVLHDVHERLQEGPERRITAELACNEKARMNVELIVTECFDTQKSIHANIDEDVENRLVAIDDLERRRMGEIHRDILAAVWRDAWMPVGFNPRFHEWSFGMGNEGPQAVPFGGALLRGTIDRVDVDDAGRAIVVDYKGSLSDGYTLPDPEKDGAWPLPLHSQILMYAAALPRLDPHLLPVGCLYVSYTKPQMKGVLDGHCIELPEGSGIDPKTIVHAWPVADAGGAREGMGWLLGEVESIVADALTNHLFEGDVEPNPRFGKKSCAYCRVKNCPRRMS